ncbi:MAG: hypothetical protein HQK91_14645 [Nitrospirae bacterium]|nr:hypothetical protein [Nitrospirota bacterium]
MENQSKTLLNDEYVTITAAEYDRLIALAKIAVSEIDIVNGNISPVFDNAKEAIAYLNEDED